MSKATEARRLASARWRERNPDYNRKWQQRNKERLRPIRARYDAKLIAWFNGFKNHPCSDCRRRYPPYVLHWDHARGTKLFELGRAIRRHVPKVRILREMKKCDLVCANCHAECDLVCANCHAERTQRRRCAQKGD